jgi:hypothetical protein
MHQATADIGAEGTVSKAVRSLYTGGRRSRFWLKAKHTRTHSFARDTDREGRRELHAPRRPGAAPGGHRQWLRIRGCQKSRRLSRK